MTLRRSQIREWLGLPGGDPAVECRGYSIDSRTVTSGDIFFAIRGPNRDGHAFVADALCKGAVGAVVNGDYAGEAGDDALLRVADTQQALLEVGARARRVWGRTVVGVTGSAGKTTTKDTLAALAGTALSVDKTQGNLNNEFGLPLTLLRIPESASVAVTEIGISHVGEMRPLADAAAPDVSVVTNVGPAHLGNFASIEEIIAEKRELVRALSPSGTAVLNADDPVVRHFADQHLGPCVMYGIDCPADFRATDLDDRGVHGMGFTLEGERFETQLAGRHSVHNILAGIAVCSVLGIAPGPLREPVRQLRPSKMRGSVHRIAGVTVIDDCYNANPPAVKAMLAVLARTNARRRVAVLGEMRELGPDSRDVHQRIGRSALDAGVDRLFAVTGDAEAMAAGAGTVAEFHEGLDAAARAVVTAVEPGDVVLLKASRGVGLEYVRDRLIEELETLDEERTAA